MEHVLVNNHNTKNDLLYRYSIDGFCRNALGNVDSLTLEIYKVIKITKSGAWIYMYPLYYDELFPNGVDLPADAWQYRKFVNLYTRKRFATATKSEALEQFIYRKKRQIEILEQQLKDAKNALITAKIMRKGPI